jgi:hypothetical protein
MSFYTGLVYYRPRVPPAMTSIDLAGFVAQLRDAGVVADERSGTLQIKFGNAIDQDELGTSCDEEIGPGIFSMGEIEWDIDLPFGTKLAATIDALTADERKIYRAHVCLGAAVPEITEPITRTNSPENDYDFCPTDLSIEVGPIELYTLSSEVAAFAGWIGVRLSGSGYLYPWTFRDVVERLDATPGVAHLTEICRSTWPIDPDPPEPAVVDVRDEIGTLWPYDDLARPWNWYWGIQEG